MREMLNTFYAIAIPLLLTAVIVIRMSLSAKRANEKALRQIDESNEALKRGEKLLKRLEGRNGVSC